MFLIEHLSSVSQDFTSTINGFDSLVQIPAMFSKCKSKLLQRITQLPSNGEFPDSKETISFFKVSSFHDSNFDHFVNSN